MMEMFCILTLDVNILVAILHHTMRDVSIGRNWVKGIWHLSVLFLIITCESIVISI